MTTIYIKPGTVLPERRPSDFYPTPPEFARAGLEIIREDWNLTSCIDPASLLDPGAGSGVWGEEARKIWPKIWIYGVEAREVEPHPDYDCWKTGSFRSWPAFDSIRPQYFHLVVGNPPYALAEQFIREGLSYLIQGGCLLFLLRLAFLESVKRRDGLFKEHQPKKVVVCSKRPSFTGNGKTNATAFAFYLFQKGWSGKTELRWW